MDKISVNLPVVWKAVVTDRLKQELLEEVQQAARQVEIELQQLDFQSKRIIPELEKQNLKRAMEVRKQLEEEREKRRRAWEGLQAQMREVQNLPLDSEITRGQLESIVEVEIGTCLDSLLEREIVTKDGVVTAIRQKKQ